jgi:hypothetical protein
MGRSTRRRTAPEPATAGSPAQGDGSPLHDHSGPDARTLARRYLDLLADEGYRPTVASDGDEPTVLSFKSEGEMYLLLVDESDQQFFHLATAWDLGDADLALATSRANELNEELKGVKLTVWAPEKSVRLHVECFVDEAPASMAVIERSLAALRLGTSRFFEPLPVREHLDA